MEEPASILSETVQRCMKGFLTLWMMLQIGEIKLRMTRSLRSYLPVNKYPLTMQDRSRRAVKTPITPKYRKVATCIDNVMH